jgi:hypothetical protein
MSRLGALLIQLMLLGSALSCLPGPILDPEPRDSCHLFQVGRDRDGIFCESVGRNRRVEIFDRRSAFFKYRLNSSKLFTYRRMRL